MYTAVLYFVASNGPSNAQNWRRHVESGHRNYNIVKSKLLFDFCSMANAFALLGCNCFFCVILSVGFQITFFLNLWLRHTGILPIEVL